jgi:hypothetical protein
MNQGNRTKFDLQCAYHYPAANDLQKYNASSKQPANGRQRSSEPLPKAGSYRRISGEGDG